MGVACCEKRNLDRKQVWKALAIQVPVLCLYLLVTSQAGSVSVKSEAIHLSMDVLALLLTVSALSFAQHKVMNRSAAFFNAALFFIGAGWSYHEAEEKWHEIRSGFAVGNVEGIVHSGWMIMAGLLSVYGARLALRFLRKTNYEEDLNLEASLNEMKMDAVAGWILVIVGFLTFFNPEHVVLERYATYFLAIRLALHGVKTFGRLLKEMAFDVYDHVPHHVQEELQVVKESCLLMLHKLKEAKNAWNQGLSGLQEVVHQMSHSRKNEHHCEGSLSE